MSIREKIEDLERKVKSQLSLLTTTRNTLSKFVEENKNLKEHKENLIYINKKCNEHIDELEEENKKLKSDLGTVIDERDNAFKKIKQLEEKVETLELWLDMKEKLNEEYRKQLGKLVMNK